jgi:putative ABC transport system substrate-binding protein
MIKKFITIFFLAIGFVLLFYFKNKDIFRYKIAILQTASHPALNKIAQILEADLKNKYNNDIKIIIKNGEGILNTLDSMANQLVCDDDCSLYVALGSPALQSLMRLEKKRPIVFGAVTDPSVLGVESKKNVCGFLDQIDYDVVINSLKQLFSDKKIGILYGVGDLASEFTIKKLESTKLNIQRFGCVGESELIGSIQAACLSSDVLFLPTDNMIASAIKMVFDMANKYKKPIFMTDILLFELGGSYAQGIDYKEQAHDIAEAIFLILNEKNNPQKLGITKSESSQLLLH